MAAPVPVSTTSIVKKGKSDFLMIKDNDNPGSLLVTTQMNGFNYKTWSISIKKASAAKQKLGFINGKIKMPNEDDDEYENWVNADSMVQSWILNTLSKDLHDAFLYVSSSKDLWEKLERRFGDSSDSQEYQIKRELSSITQALKEMPIAVKTDEPKSQHYELPTSFFKLVLGKNFKYSCCYFHDKSSTLEDAEEAMLEMYCEKSQLQDGHTILDVGCGWGSLIIYIAKKYSNCKVTGICNSVTQKAHIEEQCGDLNLQNVEVIVADISTFEMEGSYDRIFSIEMFEHMKNYKDLLKKISNWMEADGFLFVHYFCHKTFAYHFEDVSEDDWITRYFFTGGTMPSSNLLLYFQDNVSVVDHWLVNGKHYARTSEEWLKRMDKNIKSIKPIMESTYGKDVAVKWTVYWRTFFISVAELFAYNEGEEWMVTHYLFKRK